MARRRTKWAGRRCLFCGAGEVTAEHVWPDWLNEVLPDVLPTTFTIGTAEKPVRQWQGSSASITARVVCRSCNNGWMARLEDEAKPTLLPLIRGRRVELDKKKQRTVAAWAFKTAIMLGQVNPCGPKVPESDRTHLRGQGEPPSTVHVYAAAWDGKAYNTFYRDQILDLHLPPERPESREAYVATFAVQHLAFQLIGSDVHDASWQHNGEIAPAVHRFWPFDTAFKWPPNQTTLTSEGLDLLGKHWVTALPLAP